METITVYSGFSKRLNSTKRPTGGSNINVVLKQPTSVITPSFRISGFNTAWNYIQWGNRYYFVRDIVIETNTQAIYHCELDVLATYKDNIGSSSQYVTRSASAYNLNLIDTKYPTYSYTDLENIPFNTLYNEFHDGGGSFVVAITTGNTVESGGITYYAMRYNVMKQLLDYMYAGTWLVANDISLDLQKELVNPIQYIDSIKWYPFDIPNSTKIGLGSDTIKFGFWDSGITSPVIEVNDSVMPFAEQITVPNHPQFARGRYLNGNPFTQMKLSCFGFGDIPIDSNLFVNNNALTVGIGVDLLTGIAELRLYRGSGGNIFHKQYVQVGVDCKISQMTQNIIGAIGSVTGGAITSAINPLGLATGVVSGIQSLMPQLQSNGANGSKASFGQVPKLIIKRQSVSPEDISQLGRPLCEIHQISSLNGFIQCENVDIDNVGTTSEKRAIIDYMERGFFYE